MSIMISVVAGLSSFIHNTLDIKDPIQRELSAIKLIAKMPVLAAIAFRTSAGLPIVQPKRNLSYVENFLNMMFNDPMDQEFQMPKIFIEITEKLFIMHAECDQGPSTTAVRIAGSSLANPFAAISAGISSLWGTQHGGATEVCLEMFEKIGSAENVSEFLEKVKKDKQHLLYGFGHRIFKSYDPRARIIKKMLLDYREYMDKKNEHMFEVALALEEAALSDDYFIQRNLYPNIDFYSGLLMKTIHIPDNMFNVMFGIARSIGWIAHWREMMSDSVIKIYRPRQVYVGHHEREFVKIEDRPPAPGYQIE